MIEKMYINKSNKLSKGDRMLILQRWNNGWKKTRIAKRFRISRQTVYKIISKYETDSIDGILNHIPGKLRIPNKSQNMSDTKLIIVMIQSHIDWSIDSLTKKKLLAIIDDKSRFIVFAGLFENATGLLK